MKGHLINYKSECQTGLVTAEKGFEHFRLYLPDLSLEPNSNCGNPPHHHPDL